MLALLAAGCGAPNERASPASRAELVPVPQPPLAALPEAVQAQIGELRVELDARLAEEEAPMAELAAAFGRLGQHYHAYSLWDAALAGYRNARSLAPEEFRWAYLEGVVHQTRGDAEAAAASFERALELRPGDPAATLRLAETHIDAGRPDAAAALFERVLATGGTGEAAAAAHHGLGRLAVARGDHAAAARHFERVLELQPGAASVHSLLAVAYRRLGRRDDAERQIALVDAGDVRFPDPLADEIEGFLTGVGPHLTDALQAFSAGRYEDAAAAYREALALEPENPTALRGLGFTLRQAGELDAAVETLRGMVERYPDHTLARLELATTLMEQGAIDEAIAEFEALLEREPGFRQAQFNLGVALSRAGRWREAGERFERVLEIDPRDQQALYQLALVRQELGRGDEALELLERTVAVDPNLVVARQRLGALYAERGELERAAREHRAVLELEAPAEEKALAHYQLGQLAVRRGDENEAVEHYREAGRLFPAMWQAHYAQGNMLRRAGRHREAAAAFARAVQAEPRNPGARVAEAEALVLAGRHAEARRRLEAGLEELPRSAELAHALARLLATAPAPELRDGRRAFELANGVFQAFPTIEHAETVVMAIAEQGRFAEAVELQRQIIARAEREGGREHLERLRRHLDLYLRQQPVRSS